MIIEYEPIGIVHTPFKELGEMPAQPSRGKDVVGTGARREMEDLHWYSQHAHELGDGGLKMSSSNSILDSPPCRKR